MKNIVQATAVDIHRHIIRKGLAQANTVHKRIMNAAWAATKTAEWLSTAFAHMDPTDIQVKYYPQAGEIDIWLKSPAGIEYAEGLVARIPTAAIISETAYSVENAPIPAAIIFKTPAGHKLTINIYSLTDHCKVEETAKTRTEEITDIKRRVICREANNE